MLKPENKIAPTVLNHRFKSKFISSFKLSEANRSNLVQLLVWWDEDSVTYDNGQFKLSKYPTWVVYPDGIHNHYTGDTFNVVNTLSNFFDLDFPQAFYVANHFYRKVNKFEMSQYVLETYTAPAITGSDSEVDLNYMLDSDALHSPWTETKAKALKVAYAYLCNKRHIDRDIVSNFIHHRYLAMDSKNNLCFLTYHGDDVIAITKKGTFPQKPFKQNIVKEPSTGFFYAPIDTVRSGQYHAVFAFESCVDLMSYLSLVRLGEVDKPPENSVFLSMNGASTKFLDKIVENSPEIKRIYLCLDNDTVGVTAIKRYMKSNPKAVDHRILLKEFSGKGIYVKDWNEYLCALTKELNTSA